MRIAASVRTLKPPTRLYLRPPPPPDFFPHNLPVDSQATVGVVSLLFMRLPTPAAIGLPPKFEQWRPVQEDALELLLTNTKRVKGLCIPTGGGKTSIYVAEALLSGEPTAFVTDNRGLQDQILEDFASIGMVDIRGRRNYPCLLREDYTCEDGYAARCPHKGSMDCASSAAEMRAARSPLVVTNYDKWTSARKYGTGMSHFKRVVFDEGNRAPDALARAMQVILHNREINHVLGMDFPPHGEAAEFTNWRPWAAEARAICERQQLALKAQMGDAPEPHVVHHYLHLRNLAKRLATLSLANPNNWIVDELERGYQFDPIQVGRYAEGALLMRLEHILVMSATLRPKTLYMLGLSQEQFHFQEFPSDFPASSNPIYHIPTMRVDKRAHDLSMLWMRLDQIATKRQDRKGIVHTISYARRDEILGRSRYASSMLVNPQGEASSEMVSTFKQSAPGTILVSPSVGAGFDFPGRACEWQFVCKIPFQDSRSKIVQARQEADPEYGPYQAMNSLVQIFGRGMRSKEDHCENFIGDDHMEWFIPRYAHLAPKSFHKFYRTIRVLPPPPPKL